MANLTDPFVYGEIVPVTAFVDREVELDLLAAISTPARRSSSSRRAVMAVVAGPPGLEECG